MAVRVQEPAFDVGAESSAFASGRSDVGAVVTFTGLVRDTAPGDLQAMKIEHYPGMTERALAAIADQATRRWSLLDCLIIHRYGHLAPGEAIMMVATAAVAPGRCFFGGGVSDGLPQNPRAVLENGSDRSRGELGCRPRRR